LILLDTHIWVWWVNGSESLSRRQTELLQEHEGDGLGVSVISCWEVAKLVEKNRLQLGVDLSQWIADASAYPGVQLLPLTPQIAIDSTRLPGEFHNDPADQIIVATARSYEVPLLTADGRILAYDHVTLAR
jgi:PIN domain nuclease of toxin-antitoxin system